MPITKKIFFISLLILVVSLLFWGVYNLSFKKTSQENKTPDSSVKTSPEPTSDKTTPAISAISDEAVISPILSADGNYIKYYSRLTGKVYKIDIVTETKTIISDQELPGISDVVWSPDQTKVISKFVKSGSAQFYYYDYNTKKGVALKDNVDEIAWESNSTKIFYKYYDPSTKKRSLNISDPDGTNWKKLADIDYRNVSIAQIPQSGLVSFWNKADSFSETILESIPVVSGEKKSIFRGKFGADYLWSPDGNTLLVSHSDVKQGSKMELAVMNYNGGEYKNLKIPTFVSKCAWSKDNKTIYYALPGSIPSSAILPNEYQENKFTTIDTFWKINIATGESSRIIETEKIGNRYDASGLFLSPDESQLFFINKIDNKLYRINL